MLESTEFPDSRDSAFSSFAAPPPPPPPPRPVQQLYELRPLSLGEILDRTFALYRKRFWLFAGLAVLPAAVLTVGSFVQLTWGLNSTFPAFGKPPAPIDVAQGARAAIITGVVSIVMVLLHFIAFSITQAATVSAVSDVYLGKETTIKLSFLEVRKYWYRYILIVLWQSWSAMWLPILLGIGGGVCLALGSRFGTGLTILGVILLIAAALGIIYGLIAYMRNSLGVVACVEESLTVRQSMRRSKRLTANRLLRVLAVILLMYVLNMVAGVAQAVMQLFVQFSHGGERALLEALSLATTFITTAVATPVGAIAFCLFYFDARVRDEGFDVEMLLEQAVGPRPQPAPETLPSPFTSELA